MENRTQLEAFWSLSLEWRQNNRIFTSPLPALSLRRFCVAAEENPILFSPSLSRKTSIADALERMQGLFEP